MTNFSDLDGEVSRAHGVRGRLVEYARLMRLDRPIGIWLLLWPCLWALWISASGRPTLAWAPATSPPPSPIFCTSSSSLVLASSSAPSRIFS